MSDHLKLGVGDLLRATFHMLAQNRPAFAASLAMFFAADIAFGFSELVFEPENSAGWGDLTVQWPDSWWALLFLYMIAYALITAVSIRTIMVSAVPLSVIANGSTAVSIGKAAIAHVITSILILIGLAMLIVPGLFLMARWIIVVPLALRPDTSVKLAIVRSFESVRGSTGAIFACLLVIYLPLLIPTGLSANIGGVSEGAQSVIGVLVEACFSSLAAVLTLALSVAFYRRAFETGEEFADVFA